MEADGRAATRPIRGPPQAADAPDAPDAPPPDTGTEASADALSFHTDIPGARDAGTGSEPTQIEADTDPEIGVANAMDTVKSKGDAAPPPLVAPSVGLAAGDDSASATPQAKQSAEVAVAVATGDPSAPATPQAKPSDGAVVTELAAATVAVATRDLSAHATPQAKPSAEAVVTELAAATGAAYTVAHRPSRARSLAATKRPTASAVCKRDSKRDKSAVVVTRRPRTPRPTPHDRAKTAAERATQAHFAGRANALQLQAAAVRAALRAGLTVGCRG